MTPALAERKPLELAVASGVFALAVALLVRGRVHPDEIFQYLEPAQRAVYGYGDQAWEWRDGVRNWFVPGLVTLLLRGLHAVHLEDPRLALAVVWSFGAAWHTLGMLALYRIIELRSGRAAATLGVALVSTWLSYVVLAPRTLPDALAIPPLLGALLHTLRARDEGRFASGLCAGLCAGLAVVMRYPSLVFGLPLGVSLVLARRWRALAGMALGSLAVLLALGVLDLLTWGGFLHSLLAYLAFNRPGGPVASKFGAEPWWWYVLPLGGMLPVALLPAFIRGARRPDVILGCAGFYLAVLEISAHKEGRFILPLFPLGMAVAAGPLLEDLERWTSTGKIRPVALVLAWVAMSLFSPTIQWQLRLDRNLLEAERLTGRDPELHRLLLLGVGAFGEGGHFYLRRDVPVEQEDSPGRLSVKIRDERFTHALVTGDVHRDVELAAAGFRPWLTEGEVVVWKRMR